MSIFRFFILHLICLLVFSNSFAQKNNKNLLYTESHPSYLQWRKNYKLTKIEYYEKQTIFHIELEFIRNSNDWVKTVSFLPPGETNSWVLKDQNTGKTYNLLEIRHVKHNGKEIKSRLRYSKDKLNLELKESKRSREVFNCQAYFERLPSSVEKVDILEGAANKYADGHWNFFEIYLHSFNPKLKGNNNATNPYLEETIADDITEPIKPLPEPKDINTKKQEHEIHPVLNSSKDIECNKIFRLNNIQFKDNSTRFENTVLAERSLNMLYQYLVIDPESEIVLYGHTDIFGEAERNMELSKQRVEKLQTWLVERGLEKQRVQYEYHGSEKPVKKKGGPENRRVEVKIICEN